MSPKTILIIFSTICFWCSMVWVGYYFGIYLPESNEKIETTSLKAKERTEAFQNQITCSKQASEFFIDYSKTFDHPSLNNSQRNHYNKELNGCFIEVTTISIDWKGNIWYIRKSVSDPFSNKSYWDKQTSYTHPWDSSYNFCNFKWLTCYSDSNYDEMVKEYFEL